MNARHALVEAHANLVQEEIRRMAQDARNAIFVRVGWMNRSDAQNRRWAKAKKVNNARK